MTSCFPVRWDFTLVNGCLEYKRECWCYLFGCFWFYLITRFPVLSLSPVVSSLSLSPVFLVLSLSPVVSGCISITSFFSLVYLYHQLFLVFSLSPIASGFIFITSCFWFYLYHQLFLVLSLSPVVFSLFFITSCF